VWEVGKVMEYNRGTEKVYLQNTSEKSSCQENIIYKLLTLYNKHARRP
jgi:hypothetical protein